MGQREGREWGVAEGCGKGTQIVDERRRARRVAVLGSTGSIGRSALEVIARLPEDLSAVGLSAGRNWELLARQSKATGARRLAIADGEHLDDLRAAVGTGEAEVRAGPAGLEWLASSEDPDVVLLAVSGAAGLPAALAAVEAGKTLAIANKEPLVMAGALLLARAKARGATVLPVDSEHSGVFQALRAGASDEVERLILTASGGPFYHRPAEKVYHATVEQALAHPTWAMGRKVTIDSATLMNKALEIVEAHWLFGIPAERIEVLIHPESVVHAIVEFRDGSCVAQMSAPDMRTPIQYALTYPWRRERVGRRLELGADRPSAIRDPPSAIPLTPTLSLPRQGGEGEIRPRHSALTEAVGRLTFSKPDPVRWRALELGYRVAREEGLSGAVLNGANEAAVSRFLEGRIPFGRIVDVVAEVLERTFQGRLGVRVQNPGLSDILAADRWAREEVASCS
jgi:1-deoxy-D-xylulose-5-phosphate reductoisomerase